MRARALQRIFDDKKGEFIEQDQEFDHSPEFINSLVSVQAAEILEAEDVPIVATPTKPAPSPSSTPTPTPAPTPSTTPSA